MPGDICISDPGKRIPPAPSSSLFQRSFQRVALPGQFQNFALAGVERLDRGGKFGRLNSGELKPFPIRTSAAEPPK